MILKQSEKIVCAFCKLQHRVYFKKEVSFFDAILMLFITGVLAFAIWGEPDLRSLLIFMGLAFSFQIFLRVRYRESVKCPHCGFDPILYNQNNELAASRVKEHLEKRKSDPQFLLKPKPLIKPIYLSKEQIKILEDSKKLEGGDVADQLDEASLGNPALKPPDNKIQPSGQII